MLKNVALFTREKCDSSSYKVTDSTSLKQTAMVETVRYTVGTS